MADSTLVALGSIAQRRWGLFTTAQAEDAGIARKQLSRMASTGVIERVAHGVYRMAGSPTQDHEAIYATWLALAGATASRTDTGVAAIVAAGSTAAITHNIGDFFPNRYDFIVPRRKGTRLPGVRLRIRDLTREDVIPVDGLPALTVERTIADLVEIGTDISLVADAVRDAVRADKLIAPDQLVDSLSPIAHRRKTTGRALLDDLFELAGVSPGAARYDVAMATAASRLFGPLTGPTGRRVTEHRQELLDVLRRHGVTNPEIFGSAARGDDHAGSDLDLLVDLAPGTDLFDLVHIKAELEDVLGVAVDLVPRDGLKDRARAAATMDLVAL